jgi:hypothetical protein
MFVASEHDDVVSTATQITTDEQQGHDMTRYRAGGDQIASHAASRLFMLVSTHDDIRA